MSLTADCGRPSHIRGAVVNFVSTLEGSVAMYRCAQGHVPDGNGRIVCGSDGFWSRTDFFCKGIEKIKYLFKKKKKYIFFISYDFLKLVFLVAKHCF